MPKIGWVYTVFRGRMCGPMFGAGTESLEVDLFKREDIPWEKTAFLVVAEALRCYLRNAETGQFPLQLGTVLERYLS